MRSAALPDIAVQALESAPGDQAALAALPRVEKPWEIMTNWHCLVVTQPS